MISREEAIQILDNERPHCGSKVTYSEGERCEAYDMAIEALSHERPKGQWVGWHTDKFVGYDEYGIGIYRHCHYYGCRKCGRRTAVKTNYCPNCGADMREGEEE